MSRTDLSLTRLGHGALVYGLAFLISRAASFVLLPIYTRYLEPADYGVLQLLQMSLDVAAITLTAGIRNGFQRFYFKAGSPEVKLRVVSTALLLLQVFNALAALLLYIGAERVAEAFLTGPGDARLVRISSLTVLFEPLTVIPMLFMQSEQRATLYTITSTCRLVVQLGLNIWLLVFVGLGVESVPISTAATNVLVGTVLCVWTLRRTGLRVSRATIWSLLRFGLPYRVTEAGTFILAFGDRYFLRIYASFTAVGLYSLAYQFGFLLAFLGQVPFLQAWNPQRFELVNSSREERDRLYNQGFLYYDLWVVSVAVGIALLASPVVRIMADPAYHGAAALVPIIVGAYVMQAWRAVVEFGIQVSERTEYTTYATWISVALVLALYGLLIPPLGGLGAALATLIAYTVQFGFFYYWSQKLWPVSYHWPPHLRLLGFGVGVVALAQAMRPEGVLAEILVAMAMFAVFAAACWFGGVVDRDARDSLLRFARERLRATASS